MGEDFNRNNNNKTTNNKPRHLSILRYCKFIMLVKRIPKSNKILRYLKTTLKKFLIRNT